MRFAKTGHVYRLLGATSLVIASLLASCPAMAADQPKLPEEVATYFEDGLIPRLIDLYGSGDGTNTGIDFDATTTVGAISRVLEWTSDFLAGTPTDSPTELTNNWVAAVSVRGSIIGLATVWINPGNDQPELATFDSAQLATALAAAPAQSLLVVDPIHGAWFAIDGTVLTPLVRGTPAVASQTTPDVYQRSITSLASPVKSDRVPTGFAAAGIVLGIVVLALAVFILLPDSRRKRQKAVKGQKVGGRTDAEAVPNPEPDPEPEPEPKPKPEPRPKAAVSPRAVKPATTVKAKPVAVAKKPAAVKPAAKKPAAVGPSAVKATAVKSTAVKPTAVKPKPKPKPKPPAA